MMAGPPPPAAWQEIECPLCHADFDLDPPHMIDVGQMAHCIHCGNDWVADAADIIAGPVEVEG